MQTTERKEVKIGELDVLEVHDHDGEIEIDEVEIEIYAKEGKPVPVAHRYKIRIDKTHHVTDDPMPTGAEILGFVGKTPAKWKLYQILRGRQPEPVDPAQKINLRAPGVERFSTVPKDSTEGLVAEPLVREFNLPDYDTEYLDSLGLRWDAKKQHGAMWVIVHDWSIPAGYNVNHATIALAIPQGYPDTQIDMAFFRPALARADGKSVGGLGSAIVAGDTWQQWSRHRTEVNPWRPGVDDVSTHLAFVDEWLRREVEGG